MCCATFRAIFTQTRLVTLPVPIFRDSRRALQPKVNCIGAEEIREQERIHVHFFFVAITFRIANPIKEGPRYGQIWPFILCQELNTVLGLSAGCFGTPFQL
jgi:hypothetical protein